MKGASTFVSGVDLETPKNLSRFMWPHLRYNWFIPAVMATVLLFVINTYAPIWANWLAIGLFLLGVPHGAVERTDQKPLFIMPTLGYTALYLIFGIVVFSSWLISPLGTFVLFLLLSAWHFGQAEPDIILIGLWAIIGSCLIYPVETLGIFSLLTDDLRFSAELADSAKALAFLCLLSLFVEYALKYVSGKRPSILRLTFIVAILIILPPIQAVAIYFFAFHGLGEFTRTLASVSRGCSDLRLTDILKLYGPATFPAMIGAVFILIMTYQGYVPLYLASGLAIAFIIPHMVPLEKLLQAERNAKSGEL